MNRSWIGAFVGALAFASEGSARAADRDPAAAQELFQQARTEVAAGRYDVACPRFEESFRLDPTVGTLLNIADCAERHGRIATALADFTDAQGQLLNGDDRIAYVKERIARLKPRVPRLAIAPASKEPMTILRDQIEVGPAALDIPLPVEPGRHVIVVRSAGHKDKEIRVDVVEGAEEHVRAEPGEPLPIAAVPPASTSTRIPHAAPSVPSGGGGGAGPWLAGGLGVAGVGVGVVAGILALGDASTVHDNCPSHTCSGNDYATAKSAANR
jgi:hypothetical protein